MKRFFCTLALCVILSGVAKAQIRIDGDRGGRIGTYIDAFALVRQSGETLVVDGECLSACTLFLGIVPRQQVCATSRARLGFHAAWSPDANGIPVTSTLGTEVLMKVYPPKIRAWIRRKGGLCKKILYLYGRELLAHVKRCS